jgi:hypothetical protein
MLIGIDLINVQPVGSYIAGQRSAGRSQDTQVGIQPLSSGNGVPQLIDVLLGIYIKYVWAIGRGQTRKA